MIILDLFLGFLKVGCFAFGGAYGAIPLIWDGSCPMAGSAMKC